MIRALAHGEAALAREVFGRDLRLDDIRFLGSPWPFNRAFVPGRYSVLGTDGFGRSDSRVNLRRFFEVDANHIAAAAMVDLFREGAIDEATLRDALSRYDIDGGKPNPRLV